MPRKKVGNNFSERSEGSALGLAPGHLHEPGLAALDANTPHLFYEHPRGSLWLGDCLAWLRARPPGSAQLVFADPPYNIGKADWDHFKSQDEYVEWSLAWIEAAARVLAPRGSLYVCGFSEILADLRRPAAGHFESCRWLVWTYKNKANLGRGWGRSHESLLHFRMSRDSVFNQDDVRVPYGRHTLKYPEHPQAESSQYNRVGQEHKAGWTPHPGGAKPRDVFEIPVTSNGMAEKTPHPTQKPEELLRRIVLASSNPGDLVLDPFAGSGTTLVAAEQLGRLWSGCDLEPEYARWAAQRIAMVQERSVAEWIAADRELATRRESIR